MTPPPELLAELRPLLDAVCDETITPDQVRRLEELILAHPEAEAYYVQHLHFYSDLSRHFAAMPVGAYSSIQHQTMSAPRRRRIMWAGLGLVGLAAAVLIALSLQSPREQIGPGNADVPFAEPMDNSVAVLHRTYRAEWDETGMPTGVGDALPPGRLVLKSGFAHIEFYNGATVLLEGPAEFRIESRTRAYCVRGKLRANVPSQAVGFTIGSPALDLVDRGTEFGLSVTNGKSEVHVFQGRVDVYEPGGTNQKPRREVTTGEAVTDEGRSIPVNPTGFRSARDVADLAARELDRRKQAWTDTRRAVIADPELVAYFPFDRGTDDRALTDTGKARHGVIVGTTWGTSRWAGKSALEFRTVTDRVRVRIPGEFESLTLAAWVRIDGLPNVNNSLVMSDGWEVGEFHWQIGSDGSLILGVRHPSETPNRRGVSYKADSAVTPDRFGKWTHLAVTYDRPAGTVTHYIDGRAVSVTSITTPLPLRFGDGEIGNWNAAEFANRTPIRNFTGGMDDVLILAKPLSGPQIEALYADGRPPY